MPTIPISKPSEERNQEHVIKAKLFGSVGDKPVFLLLLILNIFFTALGVAVRTASCKLNATNPRAESTGTSEALLAFYVLSIIFFFLIMLFVICFQLVYKRYYERILFLLHIRLVDADIKKKDPWIIVILVMTGLFIPFFFLYEIPYFICSNSRDDSKFIRDFDKKKYKCYDYVSDIVKSSITLLAGIFYLAGDNVLLLKEYVGNDVFLSELRSTLVSGALLLYIIKDHGFKFFAELNEILSNETTRSKMSDECDDKQVSITKSKALTTLSKGILIQVQVVMQWFGLAALMVPLDAVFTSIIDNHFQGIDSTGLCKHESAILVNITATECIVATKTVIYFSYIAVIWIFLVICYVIYTIKRVHSVLENGRCLLYVSLSLLAVCLALLIPIYIAGDNNFPWINYALRNSLNDDYSICRLLDARLALLSISLVAVAISLHAFLCLMTWKLAFMGHRYVRDTENTEVLDDMKTSPYGTSVYVRDTDLENMELLDDMDTSPYGTAVC